jgi:predicted DCC family thiol-disulfide oxidoreductase YuxK
LIERLGLRRDEVGRAAWAVEAGGRRFEGAAAVNRVLRELGGGWALLGALYLAPPIRWVEDAYYRRVARRRAWW